MNTQGTISTSFGDFRYNVTQKDHVYIEGHDVKINGVEFGSVSIHLHLIFNVWDNKCLNDVYLHRKDHKEWSWAARNKFCEEIKKVWNAFMVGNEGVLTIAQRKYLELKVDNQRYKVEEAQKELNKAQEELNKIELELKNLL